MKKILLIAASAMVGLAFLISTAPARATAEDDAATLYKKCVACHGAAAEKKFDATKSDAELIETILKGKKLEKPPNMPGYEEKGTTPDQAKALVAHMKSLRQ